MTNTANAAKHSATPARIGPVLWEFKPNRSWSGWSLDVETLDWSVRLVSRSWSVERTAKQYFAKTRVFGALDAFVPGFSAEETRLHQAITDHDTKDKALSSFQRASNRAVNAALPGFMFELSDVLSSLGMSMWGLVPTHSSDETELTSKFSMRAGCSMCPCSPGHVLSRRVEVRPRSGPMDLQLGVDVFFL